MKYKGEPGSAVSYSTAVGESKEVKFNDKGELTTSDPAAIRALEGAGMKSVPDKKED